MARLDAIDRNSSELKRPHKKRKYNNPDDAPFTTANVVARVGIGVCVDLDSLHEAHPDRVTYDVRNLQEPLFETCQALS